MAVLAGYIVPHPPLIIPEVGKGQEKIISDTVTAYDRVAREIAEMSPDTIVVLSPHTVVYADYFHISPGKGACGNMSSFAAPEVSLKVLYDEVLGDAICRLSEKKGIPAGYLGEENKHLDHATFIPLWFLDKYVKKPTILRIGPSGLSPADHYELGKIIAAASRETGRDIVIVASGDLSHKLASDGPYGFSPDGPVFDKAVTDTIESGDFSRFLDMDPAMCQRAAECGLRTFQILAGALDGLAVRSTLLSYEGPFGVGYGVGSFEVTGEDDSRRFKEKYLEEQAGHMAMTRARESLPVRLARLSLETYVDTGEFLQMKDVDMEELSKTCKGDDMAATLLTGRAGTFVSLKMHGQLRGCIGTTAPVRENTAAEIIRNAVSAGTQDPRFPAVSPEELPLITYSVDILGEAEPVDSPDQLDPEKYGVIVSHGGRRGLLLPDLEGVDTVKEQIDIAREKAGIPRGKPLSLWRFKVTRFR